MKNLKIGFVGAGNMAQAIIGGMLKTGTLAENVSIFEPNEAHANALAERLGINIAASNADLLATHDVVVLAVKPQIMASVLGGLKGASLKEGAFLVSVAAGLPIALMQKWLAKASPMVRVMPNTPALVGAGVSGL
ncbi:MAG: NAD(P)-binding domain-containing protein, partial [Arenicellales bacterium]